MASYSMKKFKQFSNRAALQGAVSQRSKQGKSNPAVQVEKAYQSNQSRLATSNMQTPRNNMLLSDQPQSLTSRDMSSLDLRSIGSIAQTDSSIYDMYDPNLSPFKMLSDAIAKATQAMTDPDTQGRFLKLYHKCVWAMIKTLNKRMKLLANKQT